MLGTILSFSVMAVAGRELAGALDTFEIMLYRSAIGMVIVLGVIALQNRWHEINRRNLGTHVIRNIAHFTGQNLWFYAVALIPLAQVFALEFTTPLWVILLSPIFLGERLTPVRLFCAVLGFIGILIVTRPATMGISPGVITAAASAIFFAVAIMLTKRLTATDSIACILFFLTTIQLILGLIAAGYDGHITVPTAPDWPYVIAIALGGLLAHFCFTMALSLAPATIVSPIDFARLPTIAVVAWLLYGEALDIYIFLGAVLIFAGNYLNIWTATRRR